MYIVYSCKLSFINFTFLCEQQGRDVILAASHVLVCQDEAPYPVYI